MGAPVVPRGPVERPPSQSRAGQRWSSVSLPPFQVLVDAHWRDVGRLARALAGPVDGDDVAQRAWERALAAYPSLTDSRNLRGWLLTITARCAVDVHRARARQPVPVEPAALPDRAGGAGPGGWGRPGGWAAPGDWAAPGGSGGPAGSGGFEGLDVGLPDTALWAAVRALPERQRTAVALRYGLDLDHAEVARVLGTTPAATRRLVSDALAALRQEVTR